LAKVAFFAIVAFLAKVAFFARVTFARLAFLAMRMAVTILPAGAAGEAVVDLVDLVAALGADEDLMMDFFEIAMGVTSCLNL
jgi:hypothetical protein